MIRFIDPEYNTLFSIPDGSSIVMIWMNGNKKLRQCSYVDDLYQQHSVDRRFDIQKLKMVSASDVFVLKRRSGEKAYYVDAAGIHEIPNFLQKYKYVQPHG